MEWFLDRPPRWLAYPILGLGMLGALWFNFILWRELIRSLCGCHC